MKIHEVASDMKINTVRIADNILFTLNVFILFLLIFGDRIVVPTWLQPVGRMHPLLLHFPIVILLLALLLEFFSFRTKYTNEKFYQVFADSLLLIGTLTAAITAIMGILLSREEGYQGSVIQWHRLGGVCIVFVCSFIYYSRDASWFRTWLVKISSVMAVVCIIIAAHLGSVLTHGENFLLAPVKSDENKPVSFQEALVFRDLIKPVLADKCMGCHNEKKEKGNLILTDSAFIMRGGKSGTLFDTANRDLSLLLKRVHLPLEEKKHMPPQGKPQLTEEELSLLYHWIKLGPVFTKKIIDLPANDSLRQLATVILMGESDQGEQFDFEAADEKTIQQLNNNYRLITPIAKESPALAISFFNRSEYNQRSLQDLLPLKVQIISLDLNKMPVKDEELKTIIQFKNLRKLNLNFSDVTGSAIAQLSQLPHLRSLSLAGTKADLSALKKIAALKEMSSLVIWNTGLSDKDVQQLKAVNPTIDFVTGYKNDGSDSVHLNPPVFVNEKNKGSGIFIDKSIVLHLSHPVKGVNIRYNIGAKDPDSSNSVSFEKDTTLTTNTSIKARAYKAGWIGSDVAKFEFFRSTIRPDSIHLLTLPDEGHKGTGSSTFSDNLAGDYNAFTDKWIGFRGRDMALMYEFKNPVDVSSVGLHYMVNTGIGVFPPLHIEIWGGTDKQHLKLISQTNPVQPAKKDKAALTYLENPVKAKVLFLKIVARPLASYPKWRKSGKEDKHPWVMVDEIMLN